MVSPESSAESLIFWARIRCCQNISEEIRDLTAKDIGLKLRTLGRHMGHWAVTYLIGQILRTLSRHMGH